MFLMSNKGISSVAEGAFDGMSSLEFLDLSSNSIQYLSGSSLRGLVKLEGLGLSYNKLSNISSEVFTSMPVLKTLDLSGNSIDIIQSNNFVGASSLRMLNLQANWSPMGCTIEDGAFQGLSSLSVLKLNYFRFGNVTSRTFMGNLSSLTELQMYYCGIQSISAGAFSGLSALKILYLHYNELTILEPAAFQGLTNLKSLALSNNRLTSIPRQLLVQMPQLTWLDIGYNSIVFMARDLFTNMTSLSISTWGNPFACLPERLYYEGQPLPLCPNEVRLSVTACAQSLLRLHESFHCIDSNICRHQSPHLATPRLWQLATTLSVNFSLKILAC
jgi:Leucine-rich repeat (LRR) protein